MHACMCMYKHTYIHTHGLVDIQSIYLQKLGNTDFEPNVCTDKQY